MKKTQIDPTIYRQKVKLMDSREWSKFWTNNKEERNALTRFHKNSLF